MSNLYTGIPNTIDEEQFEALLRGEQLRIERILSKGQTSPAEGWYDQEEHEWVLVLEGCGVIGFVIFFPDCLKEDRLHLDPHQVEANEYPHRHLEFPIP